jgi:hypothetical protein
MHNQKISLSSKMPKETTKYLLGLLVCLKTRLVALQIRKLVYLKKPPLDRKSHLV